jgi:hypothetical protein
LACGIGTVISGVRAAGGRTGSGRAGGSAGGSAWTARPPIDVSPPFDGPESPSPKLMVMTVFGGSFDAESQPPGANAMPMSSVACNATDTATIGEIPSVACCRLRRTSVTSAAGAST